MNTEKKDLYVSNFNLNEEVHIESKLGFSCTNPFIVRIKGDKFFLLGHAFSDHVLDNIRPNDYVWGRYFRHREFRFRSRVLHIIRKLTTLLFLEYPHFVELIDQRSSERKKVFIRGELLSLPQDLSRWSTKGYILDVSETGCQIWGDLLHLLDRDVVLSFQIPWTGNDIETEARVVRCGLKQKGLCSGLMFINMDVVTRNSIRSFLTHLAEDHIVRLLQKCVGPVSTNEMSNNKEVRAA
jgi:hypothetical protein